MSNEKSFSQPGNTMKPYEFRCHLQIKAEVGPPPILFIVIPASGKSTFYHRVLEDRPRDYVSLGALGTRAREKSAFDAALAARRSVAVDARPKEWRQGCRTSCDTPAFRRCPYVPKWNTCLPGRVRRSCRCWPGALLSRDVASRKDLQSVPASARTSRFRDGRRAEASRPADRRRLAAMPRSVLPVRCPRTIETGGAIVS